MKRVADGWVEHQPHGNRQDDQNDGDNDEKLNKREASAAGLLRSQVIAHTYILDALLAAGVEGKTQ